MVVPTAKTSVIVRMAERFGVDATKLQATLKATAFKGDVSDAQFMALMIVADQYKLNPLTKEIYAFPDKNNGIVPVVGVDGWSRIINEHPQFDGREGAAGPRRAAAVDARRRLAGAVVWRGARVHRQREASRRRRRRGGHDRRLAGSIPCRAARAGRRAAESARRRMTDSPQGLVEREERDRWLIETLIARDFDIPEFHALQVQIGTRWRIAMDRAERAEAALREAQKDAERYRWLRDNNSVRDLFGVPACMEYDNLDAAIDAARKVGTEGPA
jgi:hypothetical protein